MTNGNDLIHSFNHTPDTEGNFKGLSKREYFAAMAMQGLCANEVWAKSINNHWSSFIDRLSLSSSQIADALIKALNETENG